MRTPQFDAWAIRMRFSLSTIMACALTASGCFAARIETITLDLERPQQPFTLTLTEATDSTVSAQLRASGSEFDPAGWTGLLWYGTSVGGQTLTNATAGYGTMTWSVPVAAMPPNGRYSVQILGSISNRVEEWGRGALTVRLNQSRDYLPAQWLTNSPAHVAALQALSGLNAMSNALLFAITSAVPTQISAAVAPLITTSQLSNALASLPVPSDDAYRLVNSNATEWIDGDGKRWRLESSSYMGWTLSVPEENYVRNFSDIPYPLPMDYYTAPFTIEGADIERVDFGVDLGPKYWFQGRVDVNATNIVLDPGSRGEPSVATGPAYFVYHPIMQVATSMWGEVENKADKELHADSFTNLIWRTVWSNGWCWVIAYTNTP